MTDRPTNDDLGITLGVEEEFMLIDPSSGDVLPDPDEGILETCNAHRGRHKFVREFMRAQIESNTRVCTSVAEVRAAIRETRGIVVRAAEEHGAGVLATSTHPFAKWETLMITPGSRYRDFVVTYQESLRRFLAGGMHIHAGFGDKDSRVRIMTALRRYLPLLHALSGSSPFSEGRSTGFKSYRLSLVDGLPRTGLPKALGSWDEFESLVNDYRRMQFIHDSSELWWDIRPSRRFPTVEMRICDICTRIDDAMCIVALYASLVRYLVRRDKSGSLPPDLPIEIIAENRWLAQRYGVMAFLGDPENGGRVDIDDYVAWLVEELAEDAVALGCQAELRRATDIVREGAGADRQVDHYRLRQLEGDTEAEALRSVVHIAAHETKEGIELVDTQS
ncbi:MAG: carboxylate-amine ligase [Bryobacterales bacterium]|nr:carboxylate-amine ligase [Bryobacterales bacterium]